MLCSIISIITKKAKSIYCLHIAFPVLTIIIAALGGAPANALGRATLPGEVTIEVMSDKGGVFQAIPHKDFGRSNTRIIKKYLEEKKGGELLDRHHEQHAQYRTMMFDMMSRILDTSNPTS